MAIDLQKYRGLKEARNTAEKEKARETLKKYSLGKD